MIWLVGRLRGAEDVCALLLAAPATVSVLDENFFGELKSCFECSDVQICSVDSAELSENAKPKGDVDYYETRMLRKGWTFLVGAGSIRDM